MVVCRKKHFLPDIRILCSLAGSLSGPLHFFPFSFLLPLLSLLTPRPRPHTAEVRIWRRCLQISTAPPPRRRRATDACLVLRCGEEARGVRRGQATRGAGGVCHEIMIFWTILSHCNSARSHVLFTNGTDEQQTLIYLREIADPAMASSCEDGFRISS